MKDIHSQLVEAAMAVLSGKKPAQMKQRRGLTEMRREDLGGGWEQEPIFPADWAKKPDGSYSNYFTHVFYNGEFEFTARAEERGAGSWEAYVTDSEGETTHTMDAEYSTAREAIEDVMNWQMGQ